MSYNVYDLEKIKSFQLRIGYMYFVTCVTMTKIRNRKLNSLVCALNDTCVETTYSMDSTRVLRAKVSKQFPTSVAFFDPQMHSDGTYISRLPMPHDLAKTKILFANKSRNVERYICRTPPPFHLSKVIFSLKYRGKVSVGWTPLGYIHSSAGSQCLSVVAVGKKFSRFCSEKDFCLDAFP